MHHYEVPHYIGVYKVGVLEFGGQRSRSHDCNPLDIYAYFTYKMNTLHFPLTGSMTISTSVVVSIAKMLKFQNTDRTISTFYSSLQIIVIQTLVQNFMWVTVSGFPLPLKVAYQTKFSLSTILLGLPWWPWPWLSLSRKTARQIQIRFSDEYSLAQYCRVNFTWIFSK